jgi:hypothetical protein
MIEIREMGEIGEIGEILRAVYTTPRLASINKVTCLLGISNLSPLFMLL